MATHLPTAIVSAVVASFAWQAAQRDEKLPRPPEPTGGRGRGAVP